MTGGGMALSLELRSHTSRPAFDAKARAPLGKVPYLGPCRERCSRLSRRPLRHGPRQGRCRERHPLSHRPLDHDSRLDRAMSVAA